MSLPSSLPPEPGPVRTIPGIQGADRTDTRAEAVAVEEPLEIRVADTPLAVTMRTPGHDGDLVLGFLLTEGIILAPAEVAELQPGPRPGESSVTVGLAPGVAVDPQRFQRSLFIASSCGICGKASIENVKLFARGAGPLAVRRAVLAGLTASLRARQPAFDRTGGLHAAGIFSPAGDAVVVREDVGRHNAVDKAIGAAARAAWPLAPGLLVVSGRQSFEIVQKAAMAGIAGVVGISAPSSLAVDLARELGMLLVGFARDGGYNVYAGADRVHP